LGLHCQVDPRPRQRHPHRNRHQRPADLNTCPRSGRRVRSPQRRQCTFRPAVLRAEPKPDLPGRPQDESPLDNRIPPICAAPSPGSRRESAAHTGSPVTLTP
jgi:hypothetical protein